MIKIIELKAKTFSKKCKNEIKEHIPHIVGWEKLHVPKIGYVFYMKNKLGNTVAHVYKENGKMILNLKEVA